MSATGLAGVLSRAASFIESDAPIQLTPVAGGDPITVNHDGRFRMVEPVELGGIAKITMRVASRTRLQLDGQYTYDGHTWTVVDDNHHQIGTSVAVRHYSLERHSG